MQELCYVQLDHLVSQLSNTLSRATDAVLVLLD